MATNYNPRIIMNGLRHVTDESNPKSYPGSGSTMTDVITGQSGTDNIPNDAVSWMNGGVDYITINCVVTKETAHTGYSTNIFTKYANTTDNTFNMYIFGTNGGAAPADDGKLRLYSYRGGVWGSCGAVYAMSIPETVIATWQYDTATGAQLWINGVKEGTASGSGGLGSASNTSNLVVTNPGYTSVATIHYTSIYDRKLSDAEVVQNYEALRGRFGV
jgi:hypothetical protein